MLGLHSILRWIILILLVVNILRSFVEADAKYTKADIKWNLRLMIISHINLLIGLIKYFFGEKGFKFFLHNSFADVMKTPMLRFWAVEHILGMIIAVVIITISRGVTKKDLPDVQKHRRQLILYVVALIIIVACIPWPFRTGFEQIPYFRGFY